MKPQRSFSDVVDDWFDIFVTVLLVALCLGFAWLAIWAI